MHKSEHDLVVLQKRAEAREALINTYIHIAIEASDEYGFLNVMGHEVPDPTIQEPPLGYVPAPDLMEQMRRMIHTELSRIADAKEFETMEEADDFDTEDEPVDYTSPYEEFFDPPPGAPAGPRPEGAEPLPEPPSAPPSEPPPSSPAPA